MDFEEIEVGFSRNWSTDTTSFKVCLQLKAATKVPFSFAMFVWLHAPTAEPLDVFNYVFY
jgi:hypothetical protein